jgi:hypothetical protein
LLVLLVPAALASTTQLDKLSSTAANSVASMSMGVAGSERVAVWAGGSMSGIGRLQDEVATTSA